MNWPISARRLAPVSFLSAALLLAATGCEKANDLGVELPGTSAINTEYRDFPVVASTVLQDSAETLKASQYLVGRVRDNVLGTTTTKAFLNLRLNPLAGDTLPATFSTRNVKLDSLVLLMPFAQSSIYGSAATPLKVDAYQLASQLDERAVYNAASPVPALGPSMGTGLVARLNGTRKLRQRTNSNSTTDTTTTVVNVPDYTLRLKLHGGTRTLPLATTVFNTLTNASFDQAALDNVWKGIALEPSADHTTSVVGFGSSQNSFSRAIFYYHYDNKRNTGTLRGTYSVRFGAGTTTDAPRYFTKISTELPSAQPFTRLNDSRQSVPAADADGNVYMQAGTGFVTKLEIPGLNELRTLANPQSSGGAALAINRAELIVPVKPFSNLLFAAPSKAYLLEANANNQVMYRLVGITKVERLVLSSGAEQQGVGAPSADAYYGAAAEAVLYPLSDTNRYYSMVLTGYVQAYAYDKLGGTPAALLLTPTLRTTPSLSLERAVLDGNNIKLRVYYSKLR